MVPRKNQDLKPEKRRQLVAEMYLRSWTMRQIADELQCSTETVHSDVTKLRAELHEQGITDTKELLTIELASNAEVSREAWKAWLRSTDTTKIAAIMETALAAGKLDLVEKALERIGAMDVGDPAYLNVLNKCGDRRAKLQGLDAPFKHAETDTDGNDLSLDDRRKKVADVVAALVSGLGGESQQVAE